MSRHINPDECPIQEIHPLFRAVLDLASNEVVAFMAANITRANPTVMKNIALDLLNERRRKLQEESLAASQQQAAERLEERRSARG